MTVGIATLFRWNYGKSGEAEDWGVAALVASDRMITAGDVEYEPNQLKVAHLTKNAILVIAGQYPMHTQALKLLTKPGQLNDDTTPETIANLYGKAIQKLRMQLAEDAVLAPFGMNTDTFIAQQRDMADGFVDRITSQLQEFQGPDVEALVVGLDTNKQAEIWGVDFKGTPRCFDDVGFHAIGIGAGHASLSLMQSGYTNHWRFPEALAATYTAKRVAETAPGVGDKNTDIHFVGRLGWISLWPEARDAIERIYKEYREKQETLVQESIARLSKEMWPKKTEGANVETEQGLDGKDPQPDAGAGENATEATRGNENRNKKNGQEAAE